MGESFIVQQSARKQIQAGLRTARLVETSDSFAPFNRQQTQCPGSAFRVDAMVSWSIK